MTVGLNEDTLGGTLKASLAQYLALEISKGMALCGYVLDNHWRQYKCSIKKMIYCQFF